MSLFQALVLFGNKDEDKSDNPFIWGRVLTDSPKDDEGKTVKNPGSIMVYGAKGIKTGDCEHVVLVSRGIGGLYDLLPADKVETVLTKMKKTLDKLPEVPLAESRAVSTDRASASKDASAARKERRQARQAARGISSVAEPELEEQPD